MSGEEQAQSVPPITEDEIIVEKESPKEAANSEEEIKKDKEESKEKDDGGEETVVAKVEKEEEIGNEEKQGKEEKKEEEEHNAEEGNEKEGMKADGGKEEEEEGAKEDGDDGFETPEEGDGDEKNGLDDDEIEANPAYIPKTGRYYMHDSRRGGDDDDELEQAETDLAGKDRLLTKPSRADGMWNHDRFDQRWQAPKNRRQLVEKYGFDIRLGETKEEAEEREQRLKEEGRLEEDDERQEEVAAGRHSSAPRGGMRGRRQGPRPPRYNNNNTSRSYHDHDDDRDKDREGEEDDVRPAQRRRPEGPSNYRDNGDSGGGGGRGRGAYRGSSRGARGWAAPTSHYPRTFNNSARGRDRGEREAEGTRQRNDRPDRNVNHQPKRYSTQRAGGGSGDARQSAGGSGDARQSAGTGRQATDIVYFDPAHQPNRASAPERREKKILDIVAPQE